MTKFGEHEVFLLPDMSIVINGHRYEPHEMQHFGDRHPIVKVSRIGDVLFFKPNDYPFTVIFEGGTNIKVVVNEEEAGHVDGLCGYFDKEMSNDREMPDGRQARSTQEFGDSWEIEGTPRCAMQVCPQDLHQEAWKICNAVKDRSMSACNGVTNLEKFISCCLETTCNCLNSGNSTSEECRCRALTSFVTECQAADRNIDLSTWRSAHDCPVQCKAPFVHKDCFRYVVTLDFLSFHWLLYKNPVYITFYSYSPDVTLIETS